MMRSPTQKCGLKAGFASRQTNTPSIWRIGIDHVGHLTGPGKEMLVNEPIAVGEKDPEVRVGVIPADDRQTRRTSYPSRR